MEIELKYSIEDATTAEKIWNDKELMRIEEADSRKVEEYEGHYFDTEGYDLLKNDIAYRVRREGDEIIGSLKWKGTNDGALHVREELNVKLGAYEGDFTPRPEVFKDSQEGSQVLDLVGDGELVPIIEVNVLRKSFRVDTGKSLLEISIDTGEIKAGGECSPVGEIEIELYSGEKEDLESLGRELKKKYNIEEEHRSKFARGLALLGVL